MLWDFVNVSRGIIQPQMTQPGHSRQADEYDARERGCVRVFTHHFYADRVTDDAALS